MVSVRSIILVTHSVVTLILTYAVWDLYKENVKTAEMTNTIIATVNQNANHFNTMKNTVDTHGKAIIILAKKHQHWGKASMGCSKDEIDL